jgi:SAM-dependent methyltransferase
MNASPNCRFCNTPLTATLVDLGAMPLANSYVTPAEVARERRFPLHARVCPACLLVQVGDSVPPDAIFSDYPYFSSYADSWVEHARRYAEAAIARFGLTSHSLVVEVASNDGYLLQHFQRCGVPVLGIDPAANVAQTAVAKGIATEVAFFGTATAKRLAAQGKQADLMVANNVLAHVPDIRDFMAGFALLLNPDGVVTFEFPHVLNLIREVQFDMIYHEHFSYLSLLAVERVFAATGLKAIDVEEIQTHGGSLRLYAARQGSSRVPTSNLNALRVKERDAMLDRLEGYDGFAERVKTVMAGFLSFVAQAKAEGKKIAAYGAAAKGNTFLNYCGVTTDHIVCVFDRSAAKQGKLLPGSHIPILAPARMVDVKPDYLVILPWNLISEIKTANAVLTSWGGRFVVAIPQLRIFS